MICWCGDQGDDFIIKVGSYEAAGGIAYEIEKVLQPGGYMHGHCGCNMELIVLEKNITFNDPENPSAIIDISGERPFEGQECIAAGFGAIDTAGTPSQILLQSQMTSLSDSGCVKEEDQLCFVSEIQSFAGGDSGAGYIYNGI
uniref:Peptidase S1 domain-containing protein n=1 Tax=Panagrolaimus davidi TaxID=227884 RepID=A0A914PAL3_9BILA